MLNKIGLTLAVLNSLMAIGSGLFFLFVEGLGPVSWLVVNTCALTVAFFIAGYYLERSELLAFAVPWLFFYGTGGLFVFEWGIEAEMLVPQLSHLIMTATVIYIIFYILSEGSWKWGLAGLIAGIIAVSLFFPWQQNYQRENPEVLERLHFREGFEPTAS